MKAKTFLDFWFSEGKFDGERAYIHKCYPEGSPVPFNAISLYKRPFSPDMLNPESDDCLFEGWEAEWDCCGGNPDDPFSNGCDGCHGGKGWMTGFTNAGKDTIDVYSEHPCIGYIPENTGVEYYVPSPDTLDQFIGDCERAGIELEWNESGRKLLGL